MSIHFFFFSIYFEGKSSQVPQFLLEENMKPILCTQPRRFAVVAVAKMVAKARNCELGGEVGYHIGHSKLLSAGYFLASILIDHICPSTVLCFKSSLLKCSRVICYIRFFVSFWLHF